MTANLHCRCPDNGVKHPHVNQLYFGDNLMVLRDHIAAESVDLIYLDPPFNSKRDYNLLFKSPKMTGRADLPVSRGGGEAAQQRRPTSAQASIHKIVVSVKGGGLKADDVRSLMAVREREGAEIGLFISLEEPTRGMVKDAASAGFYESATGKKYPRVQLLTIEGLLSGKQRAEHPDHAPDLNFKKAKAESNAAQKELI
jgi:hypothetical protein